MHRQSFVLLWDHSGDLAGRQMPVVCMTALQGDGPDANPGVYNEELCLALFWSIARNLTTSHMSPFLSLTQGKCLKIFAS